MNVYEKKNMCISRSDVSSLLDTFFLFFFIFSSSSSRLWATLYVNFYTRSRVSYINRQEREGRCKKVTVHQARCNEHP